jgi:anti-anti-sigma regulatory factor
MHYAGGHLVLCELSDPVTLALQLSGLLEHFIIETSRGDAVGRVAAATSRT